jgi:predicted Zn finger-like uncharacterized protein
MMKLYTRCPHCDTVFRVTPPQLQSSGGQVRCGRCDKVFDAFSSLRSKQPTTVDKVTDDNAAASKAVPETSHTHTVSESASTAAVTTAEVVPSVVEQQSTEPPAPAIRIESETNLYEWEFRPLKQNGLPWIMLCASLLTLLALMAQAAIAFRSPLALEYPQSRPWLLRVCEHLRCSLPLPRLDEKLHIESSGLEAINPAQPSQILLTAAVRNRANLAVAYPALELTLTDDHDLAIARRVFLPREYVASGVDLNRGFEAGSEINARLFLDTADLRAAGYRLYLFYP